jgi:hypothetical protein
MLDKHFRLAVTLLAKPAALNMVVPFLYQTPMIKGQ